MRVNKPVQLARIFRANPPGELEPAYLEAYGQAIFRVQPLGEDVELQGANDTRDRARPIIRQEQLHDAFLGHLPQSFPQLLRFHGIAGLDAAKDFGRETWHPAKDEILAFRQRIANAQGAVVWNADDIAGKSFLGKLTILREEKLRRVERDILAGAHELGLHATRQFTRTNAQKRDSVAMIRVHVRLDFKHKAGHL